MIDQTFTDEMLREVISKLEFSEYEREVKAYVESDNQFNLQSI